MSQLSNKQRALLLILGQATEMANDELPFAWSVNHPTAAVTKDEYAELRRRAVISGELTEAYVERMTVGSAQTVA